MLPGRHNCGRPVASSPRPHAPPGQEAHGFSVSSREPVNGLPTMEQTAQEPRVRGRRNETTGGWSPHSTAICSLACRMVRIRQSSHGFSSGRLQHVTSISPCRPLRFRLHRRHPVASPKRWDPKSSHTRFRQRCRRAFLLKARVVSCRLTATPVRPLRSKEPGKTIDASTSRFWPPTRKRGAGKVTPKLEILV